MKYAIFEGAHGARFVGEPGFGELVAEISKASGAEVTSHVREPAAADLLRSLGKSDQGTLWRELGPGHANPPGYSTHERRSDGSAYPLIPRGAPLPFKWMRGIDVSNTPAFIKEAVKRGFTCTLTYPSNPNEGMHVNFRKEPKIAALVPKPLRRGSTGVRVRDLARKLMVIRDPDTKRPYLSQPAATFTERIEDAVRAFQRDHHQKPDGIVGTQTARQVGVSYRYWSAK